MHPSYHLLVNGRRLVTIGCRVGAFLAVAIAMAAPVWAQARQPVFIGARACAECHDGKHMGDQFSIWMRTRHAKAYTSLAKPEAKQIAILSGIPVEPQESPMCLGCHATGAEAEDWEKDDAFSLKDGVQCEKCHGPGSEYADPKVMMDRKLAMSKGLVIPSLDTCRMCHLEKGSHTAVLKRPPIDIDEAIQKIAHPTPKTWKFDKLSIPPPAPAAAAADQRKVEPVSLAATGGNGTSAPKYTGSLACGTCHAGRDHGFQFSKWRASKHADAYASLSTPEGWRIAAEMGVQVDPRTSTTCLKCHSTAHREPAGGVLESFAVQEGVGCEACHGPGSGYSAEAVMKDKTAAANAGLKTVAKETCLACHANAHGKPFDYEASLKAIAHPTKIPPLIEEVRYKTPINLALRPGSTEMYVTCEAANTVIVVDTAMRRKIAEIAVGGQPQDVCFTPDGLRAFVSNRLDDTVSVIDARARKVVATIAVGDEPHGVLVDRAGKYLYVLNTSSDNVSVIDASTLQEIKILAASRSPWSLALSPDGTRVFVTNSLSRFVPFRTPAMSEVTVIDTERAAVDDRVVLPETNLLQGVAWHPSGKFALVTMLRTKNLVPMTRLTQGWTITNGLGIVWADGRVDQVLLDEPGISFPDPTDVAITPDGRFALVTSSSTDRVAVVDVAKLLAMLDAAPPEERRKIIPNHMGKSAEFLVTHIPTKNSPRGILIDPAGKTAYAANALDDSITVIDLATFQAVERIDLDGPKEITKARFGERLFNSAKITFRRQFSCHSCHPDGHIDDLTYDIESDGIGNDPVDNRTLRGILDTAPFKWAGTNPSLSRQCGARLAVFFTKVAPFTPEELSAVDYYVCTIPRPPNRYRPLGAKLTDAQRRGKMMFERTRTNDGREIPIEKRCTTCHFPPLYTDRRRHDVGTKYFLDKASEFDVPHLNNIYDSAPYLHNGMADTLEEIWTRFNPYDKHGVTNDMTKDQLNDLIEYLKTL
ncbi:MAG: beta-propeller fold lactonase family protein [Thermoguttaceae bacterium]|jgi:YVTN family beta-propeller protein|nr:beta-propeller fold lactonase family protein [Thermoguttaceae bacterium]